jgi:cation diffusion facilitator family transporter
MSMSERQATIQKVTLVGIAINIVLSATQIVAGMLAHSQALIADGMHTLADLFSDFIVMITAHHSHREADESHPYGHARIETLSSIFLGFLLIVVAIGMGYRGIQYIVEPPVQQTEAFALFFAFLAIACKEFLYRYTLHAARNIKSTLLEANALHHRSDAFSSIVVVIGVAAQVAGVAHMDALAALVVSIMIALMGAHLVRKSFSELIDTSLDQDLVDAIRDHVLATEGVMAVHRLRSRSMAGLGYIDLEIRVNPRLSVSEAHFISLHIEQSIKHTFNEILDVTVHIDPLSDDDHEKLMKLPSRARLLFSLYSAWEKIEGAENISNIHLHYLTDQIEIDVILPLNDSLAGNVELAQQLKASIRDFPYIGKINIYYTR